MYLPSNYLEEFEGELYRKAVRRVHGGALRVVVIEPPVRFLFFAPDHLLDTRDLQYLFGCSARTVYRWVNEEELKPALMVGREMLFSKRDIMDWFNTKRPRHVGRPKS